LRNFDDLFNDPGNNDNLLDNLLNFDNLGDFNHFFDDLVNVDSDLFDSLDGSGNFDDLLNNNFDGVVLGDEMVDRLLNLDDLIYLDNLVNVSDDFDDLRNLDSLDDDLGNNFWNSHDLLLNDGNFNSSVNNLLYLLDQGDGDVDNSLDFFYSFLVDDFLFNNLNLLDGGSLDLDLNDFLNSSGNLHDLFDGLDDGDGLFDNDLNYFGDIDNLVDGFSGVSVFDDLNRLFNDSVKGFDDLNNSLNDFFPDDLNLNNFSDNPLNGDNLFPDDFDFSDFRNCMVNNPFDNCGLFDLNNLLLNNSDLNDLGDLNNSLYYFLNDFGNLNNLFGILRDFDDLFDDVVHDFDDLNGHVNNLLDLLDLDDLNRLFDDSFDGDNLRNFNDSVNDFFDNLFDFNDLGNDSENLEDIVNIDNAHDFSVDHANDSLIDVKDNTGLSFDLF